MGLLDFINTPSGMGLLSAVAGGMAGARRGTPINNIGRGLVTGVSGYQSAQDQIRQDQENALTKQYRELQMQQLQRQIEQQKAQQAWKAGLPNVMTPKVSEQGAQLNAQDAEFGIEGDQATLDAGRYAGANAPLRITPQVDQQAVQDYLMQPDSPYADDMIKTMLPKPPKWSVVERYNTETGMPEKVLMDENNPSDIRPFGGAQADTVVADNLGGSLVYRGSRSAKPIGTMQRTVSPDAQLSASTARRGQDISNANAAAARAVTIRGQDLPPKAAKGGPMSVTLQKELLESDDTAQASQAVIGTLNSALKINNKAYSGYGAKPRAVLRSNLPGQSDSADATIAIDNMMTGQALESLKLIFGGMPTEGERKILLDMQASSDKTPKQREEIMKRAIAAAQRRGAYAKRKADAIRKGTYLNEGVPDVAPTGGVKFLGFE